MKLDNKIISIEVSNHGAELKSAVKNGREYMWCGDEKYWGRTSPVLFPFVGKVREGIYKIGKKEYPMGQHGFARDNEFTLVESGEDFLVYQFSANEETLKKYPYNFVLTIKYTLIGECIKVEWKVENKGDIDMHFSIGAHPAFNLKNGKNYFKFDTKADITYNLVDESGLYSEKDRYILKCNDGYAEYIPGMFDKDAYIVENRQASEVSLCDDKKNPYVTVKFSSPLFGLWSPVEKNAPFVCIEPWYGRCDKNDFSGELKDREYSNTIKPNEIFCVEYDIILQ